MNMIIVYTLLSVLSVTVVSLLGSLPLLLTKRTPQVVLMFLVSLSIGALLGSVFIHFLPEATSHGYTLGMALNVLIGFFTFFVIEKLVHNHHDKKLHSKEHGHAYHLAPLNLAGEAIHNFIDGLVIAGAYLVSIPLGIAATISVIVHEVPQEIADFGILLYSGFSKKKALIYNFLAATTAIVGAVSGLWLGNSSTSFTSFIIPFAAGAFIYIGASNLTPELHKQNSIKDLFLQIVAAAIGIGLMVAITLFGPAHVH